MSQGPLSGIRVVDLSAVVSGPMAACWLGDQGAEVVKVEPFHGDSLRTLGPTKADLTSAFVAVNRGKRGIALDLKREEAKAIVAELIARADVLVENFRPGVMGKLGLGWEAARVLNPRLVYCSITGFGPDGPHAGLRAYDPVIQAASGIAANQRNADGEPSLVQTLVVDKLTALTAAQAITAALFARERTGEGQRVEVAMLDAAVTFNWPEGMFNFGFVDDAPPPSPAYGRFTRLWKAKDGMVAIASFQDHEFTALVEALDRPDLAADERFATGAARARNIREWGPLLAGLIAERTTEELLAGFVRTGAAGARVNECERVIDDAQVVHNRVVHEVPHGGAGRIRVARHPARFGGTPVASPSAAPRIGEHSRALLRELGRDEAAIDALVASGAVR
jgi:crotonobetainyl-CoA:carnitine CoA-transferase CaiB-like acyl-CoA transferase